MHSTQSISSLRGVHYIGRFWYFTWTIGWLLINDWVGRGGGGGMVKLIPASCDTLALEYDIILFWLRYEVTEYDITVLQLQYNITEYDITAYRVR